MTFVPPTVDEFRTDFSPVFDNTDEGKIALALRLGGRMVDQSWTDEDGPRAIGLYAAHFLTGDAEASTSGGAVQFVQSESLGSISVAYARDVAELGDATGFSTTVYGREFMILARLNRGGARSF